MAEARRTVRELIQEGLQDTERLISQKQYNLAMIKSRQTLEYMVKSLCRRNNIPDGDLMDMIDNLYRQDVISRDTLANYHKIRKLGNEAVHNNDNNAYNAHNSYLLLSQEVYSFRSRTSSQQPRRSSGQVPGNYSGGGNRTRKPPRPQTGPAFTPFDLLKILIPVLAIILIVSVIRLVKPGKAPETTAAVETTAVEETIPEETEAPTEPPETEPAVLMVYTTKSSLNVRSAPSRDSERLGLLPGGTAVDYVGAYNSEWAIINYNGGQAYVAAEYLDVSEIPAAEQ